MNINIGMAKDALSFSQPQSSFYKNLRLTFEKYLRNRFSLIIEDLCEEKISLDQRRCLEDAFDDKTVKTQNIFSSPEFIAKVLDYPYEDAKQICDFYLTGMQAELARENLSFDHEQYPSLWTTAGDYFTRFNKDTSTYDQFEAFTLNDRIVLDFFSPGCMRIDNKELGDNSLHEIEGYNYDGAFTLYEKLAESLAPLQDFPNKAIDLIVNFTRTIILKKQVAADQLLFSSASLYPYIGRSLLINAEHANASQVVDALVHESIHSLLYTIDALNKWMPSNTTIHSIGAVIKSPWTGKLLTLGNYCQAIFVWFGLFNFWRWALEKNLYDEEYGAKRIARIYEGFQQVEIHNLNEEHCLSLNEMFLQTVESIKSTVLTNAFTHHR